MPTIEGNYLDDLRNQIKHLRSENIIYTDAPVDNNGKGENFSPTDLVAGALGACMMTIMGIYARNNNIDLGGTHYTVNKIMASNPRRIEKIELAFFFPEDLLLSPKTQEALKRAALTCPVSKSLHPDLQQHTQFYFASAETAVK